MSKNVDIKNKPWPYSFFWSYFDSIDYQITEEEFDQAFEELKKKSLNAFSEVARSNQESGKSTTSKDIEREVEESKLPKIVQEFIKERKVSKKSEVLATVVSEEDKPETEIKSDQQKPEVEANKSEKQDLTTEVSPPVVLEDTSPEIEDKSPNVAKIEPVVKNSEPFTLNLSEKSRFLSRFKNLGFSFGFSGGRRAKLKSAFDNSEFSVVRDSVSITKNSYDENLVQITFDGNCNNVAMVSVGENCYVKALYDKKTGLVEIVPDKVFHVGQNGEEKEIDLRKKSSFLGRIFGGKGDLEKEIGKDQASQVRDSFKKLKLMVCANPSQDGNSNDCSVTGVAALIDGKTRGVQMGKKTAIAASAVLAGVGTVAVLTGVGVLPGAAAIVGAASLAGATIAKTSTTAAFATASFAQPYVATIASFS
ncbi:MAG: hypothetical protein FJ368_03850, partial [Pelagibacterales bacterium]|nr:hypothetical protein [Pelagibacterales bacterium]